ncbi:hypothetical protein PVAP13_3NG198193 [Panicum virgatum]|uniref:Uncharacterized protein n=1 Tax=Panicum virgatum TaxID=38727 RepID=A0A8T0TWI4_PANVG|nr:hypothetical protein PVAP13_3NG198193 [Panicum virgatum]
MQTNSVPSLLQPQMTAAGAPPPLLALSLAPCVQPSTAVGLSSSRRSIHVTREGATTTWASIISQPSTGG